jgi:hypothetical protein
MKMKKIFVVVVILALVFSLTACGGSKASASDAVSDAVDKALEDAFSGDSFTEKSAAEALKLKGIDENDITPDWDFEIDEELMATYGDSSHGSVMFIKKGDEDLTDDEYNAWLKKVFDATAKASDDGHNIQGFSWGEGDVEKTWEEFIASESMIITWSYKHKDEIMDVYIERVENPNKESEVTDDFKFIYHYYAVKVDIATGLQKSMDETLKDAEEALEGHEDEIEEALKNLG